MDLQAILKYPIVLAVGFVVTYFLTPLMRRCALRVGMIDHPESRRVHSHPIPYGGGIAVFLGFHAVCAVVFLAPWASFEGQLDLFWWQCFGILSSILLVLGIVDDICNVKAFVKLGGQVVIAVLAFAFDMRVGKVAGFHLPFALDLIITVFWFLALINAFNLIDGMDGLASGLASIAAFGMGGAFLFRHMPGDALIMLGLMGTCLAFLRYNFHPASIFLGDAGSMFMGFTIAAVSLSTGAKGTAVATVGVPLLAVGLPLFDTVLAVWRRSVRSSSGCGGDDKKSTNGVFSPDLEHLHHRLVSSGLSQRKVALLLYVFAAVLVAVGFLSMVYHSYALAIYILAFITASYVIMRHLARFELWDSGAAILRGMNRPARRFVATLFYIPVDIIILCVGFIVAMAATGGMIDNSIVQTIRACFDNVPVRIGIPFVFLCFGRTYSRVWSLARISDYFILAVVLTVGILAAAVIESFYTDIMPRDLFYQVIIYGNISLSLLVLIRMFPRFVRDIMATSCMQKGEVGDGIERLLVYGAGDSATLFLREMSFKHPDQQRNKHVVGLVSEDSNLHGRFVHGFKVFGSIDAVKEIIQHKKINTIVVTKKEITRQEKDALKSIADNENVKVLIWGTVTETLI
ncbi:hypothetical protein ACFLS1_03635 [Verrucomicrobiota bacterium]